MALKEPDLFHHPLRFVVKKINPQGLPAPRDAWFLPPGSMRLPTSILSYIYLRDQAEKMPQAKLIFSCHSFATDMNPTEIPRFCK